MPFGSLGTIWSEIGLNTAKLDAGLMAAQTKLAAADRTVMGFGQRLTANSTKLITAGGLMAGSVIAVGIASIKMAADFETSMRNVNSISKLSEDKFKALGESVVGISKKFPQSAKELADGLYDIASSGFQGADGLKVLEASASAASAGLTNTATSAKGITAVLNAYGLEADKAAGISDTMFKTVDKGVITFEELSSTVGDWVGMSKAANISFNEASGAIAYMTTKGISASEAGVSLQRMLTGIIKPSEEMATVIRNAGFESGELMLKQLGLTGTMKVLNDTTGGSITKLIELIPEIRGVRGANALLGSGYEDLTKFMGDFKDTTGATSIALAEQSKSLSFQLDILKNNATALGIELGQKLIPPLADLVKKLNDLSPATKDNIYNFAEIALKVVGAGGGVLLLAGAFGKLRIAMLANPIGAVIAGFVALNGAVDTGANKLEAMDNIWATIGATLIRTLAPLTLATNGMKDQFYIYGALKDGTLSWKDAQDLNIFTIEAHRKKIQELRAEQEAENLALGTVTLSTQQQIDLLSGGIPTFGNFGMTVKELTESIDSNKVAVDALIAQTPGMTQSQAEITISEEEAKKAADKLKTAVDNLNNALASGAISPQEYITQLEILGLTLKDVEGGFEAVVNAAFRLFNANAASEQAIISVDEALKKYNEALNATTGHVTANSEAAQAWLASNVSYQKNLAKSNELQAKINQLQEEGKGSTSTYFAAVEQLGKVQSTLNQLTNEAATATGSYTSTGKQSEEQIKATKAAADALSASIQQEIVSLQFEYSQVGTSVERQKELQNEFINSGLQAVTLGSTSIASFMAMATGFGLSSANIIAMADAMGIELDIVTRQRIIKADIDYQQIIVGSAAINGILSSIPRKIITVYEIQYNQSILSMPDAPKQPGKKSMGGIIGYAMGGIIGSDGYNLPALGAVPHASSGMVVPQMGRSYLIQAEQDEIIANSSQQRNLAEWIMGKANSRPDGKGSGISIENFNVITPNGTPAEIARESKLQLRLLGLEASIR